MVTVLLMLLMLGVFIHSSQASLKCYKCTGCDKPTEETCHNGDVCLKVRSEVAGAFTIYGGRGKTVPYSLREHIGAGLIFASLA